MIGRTLMIAGGLATGIAASQAPEFAQQYRQRLGGAIDELTRQVVRFDEEAKDFGLTPDAALYRLAASADPVARARGVAIGDDMERLDRLSAQREAFRTAGSFDRLSVLAEHVDPDLARATWRDFEPAVPTTAEGAATAGLGFLAGGTATAGLLGLLKMSFLRRRARA